jgi:hypothetical protein
MPLVTSQGYQLQPDILGAIQSGQKIAQNQQILGANRLAQQQAQQQLGIQQQTNQDIKNVLGPQQGRTPKMQDEQLANILINNPKAYDQVMEKVGLKKEEDAILWGKIGETLSATSPEQRANKINEIASWMQQNGQPQEYQEKLINLSSQPIESQETALQMMKAFSGAYQDKLTTGQRDFKSMTEGFTPEEKLKTRKIQAKLELGAQGGMAKTVKIGGVDYTFDPTTQSYTPVTIKGSEVTAETIGESEKKIAEAKKRGELSGKLAGDTIEEGFKKISSINSNMLNLDRAISAVERGAGTGAIEKMYPSIKAASVELDQIQGELGLDVVGAVTFGALSEGELALAKSVALPTGLDGPELKKWLLDKKAAQTKLRDYFNQQIQFLDAGGTIPQWLKQQESKSTQLSDEDLLKKYGG